MQKSLIFSLGISWLIASFASTALATYLTINGSSDLRFQLAADKIQVSGNYEITNEGDENARAVFPALQLGSWTWTGEPKHLARQEKAAWSVSASFPVGLLDCGADCAGLKLPVTGRLPLMVRRHYEDLNGVRFSATEIQGVDLGDLSSDQLNALRTPEVDGVLICEEDGDSNRCELTMQNFSREPKKVTVAYYSSQEIRVLTKPQVIELEADAGVDLEAEFKNFSGLYGSTYIVYALLQWEEKGVRNLRAVHHTFRLERPKENSWYLWLAIAAPALLGVLIYTAVLRPRRQ